MDFALPEIGEGVYEAELIRWLVQPGDTVKRGQPLAEVMTDKATMEVPSPFAGKITALRAQTGQQIKIGQVLLTYEGASQAAAQAAPAAVSAQATAASERPALSSPISHNGPIRAEAAGRLPVKAAPSVRHLARKLGIDLGTVHGSGPEGRVLLEDLAPRIQPTAQTAPAEAPLDYGKPGTRIKMQGLRRSIAQHMVLAKRTIPHYSYIDECDVTELVRLRDSLRDPYARAGVKLTYLAFFVKAVVAALKEVPITNASLDEKTDEIVLHDRYHIGIATATPSGLVVPVVRDADRKDLGDIAREIERLSSAARAGKSRREDLLGGTFTVTSVGNLGGLISTPVINHPEVAILGIGKIVKRPVYDAAGQIRPADIIYLSLSFDHRVVDGAVGAAFANVILRQLQNPAVLLLPARL
jgi:pyruvate dehydrogenase E2 component (dihydrolipoamide acetyltransferase)/2-oxoisovalerate dehydrogenase E2 component (dihydrolipoyl transacylase)